MGEPRPKPIEYRQTMQREPRWAVPVIGAAATMALGIGGLVDSGISSDVALAIPAGYSSVDGSTHSQEASTPCSPKRIVVLGSSTAAGVGANPPSNAWVSRYAWYLNSLNPENKVFNLAVAGDTTYQALPDGSVPPIGRPSPDSQHNITAALSLEPDAIIVNFPSNDVANGIEIKEIEDNFQKIQQTAEQEDIPIWIATPQPRNLPESKRKMLITLKEWVQKTFPEKSLDFWSSVAKPDGTQNDDDAAGDGIHLNNKGHKKLAEEVSNSDIASTLCGSALVRSQH